MKTIAATISPVRKFESEESWANQSAAALENQGGIGGKRALGFKHHPSELARLDFNHWRIAWA